MKKTCTKCNEEKDETEFYVNGGHISGRRPSCKNCQRIINAPSRKKWGQERYKNDPVWREKTQKRSKASKQKFHITAEGRIRHLMHGAKGRAKRLNLSYDLDLEFLMKVYNKQNGCCALTNIPFDLSHPSTLKTKVHHFSPSIDRINPALGYTKDNIRILTMIVNQALGEYGDEIFAQVCEAFIRSRTSPPEELPPSQ